MVDNDKVQDTDNEELDSVSTVDERDSITVDSKSSIDTEKLLAQKRKANREAQVANKRAAELEAELQAYRDKEKSETEKWQDKAKQAEEQAARLAATIASKERAIYVRDAGVNKDAADYVSWKMEQAQKDDDFDADEFLAGIKKAEPYLFGQPTTQQAPKTGSGGPATGSGNGKTTELQAKLDEVNNQLAAIMSSPGKGARAAAEQMKLMRIRKMIQKELGG